MCCDIVMKGMQSGGHWEGVPVIWALEKLWKGKKFEIQISRFFSFFLSFSSFQKAFLRAVFDPDVVARRLKCQKTRLALLYRMSYCSTLSDQY